MIIEGHAAIVTGGASGLGEATARALAAAGGKVAVFDLNAVRGEQVAMDIDGVFAEVDICDEASVEAGIELATSRHGPARILVNCAAIPGTGIRTAGKKGPFPLDVFRRLVDVNLIGTFNVTRLVAYEMLDLEPLARQERGVIINVASINALDGPVGGVAYTAAKAGVVGMTITIARDLAPRGIRACTIAPGSFETPMLMGTPKEMLDQLLPTVPFPNDRFGDPDEFASLVRHICENVMLNGETIRLDGAIRHTQTG